MKVHRGMGLALSGVGLVVLSCSASAPVEASVSTASGETLAESRAAAARFAELRTRFRLPLPSAEDARLVTRAAHVALPLRAGGEVKLEDETSHLSVGFALEHVQDARIEIAGGMALYRGALDGADVVHRVRAEGTEDFVVFETRPAREELSYAVDVSRIPGLRLVSNTLEFLDETGTPVLRVAPPYVVDAQGKRHAAKLALSGCAYDTSPAGPWGRKVTKPGAGRCTVHVAWGADVAYPAMVDPAWEATGSMATARAGHSATMLASGRVLVVGGSTGYQGNTALASAELFDPAGNAGAGTFAATVSMTTPRPNGSATVLPSGKILFAGGYSDGGTNLASAELYDPAGNAGAGAFVDTGPMVTGREGHTASVLLSGKVFIAGGRGDHITGGVNLVSAELYDPAGNAGAGTFVAIDATTANTYFMATVLASGKVLLAGGGPELRSAELFDPAGNGGAGAFSATGMLATRREGALAILLRTGRVLFAGGVESNASAELFDPAGNGGAGTFTDTGDMGSDHGAGTASLLPSGKVLVVGGFNGNSGYGSAELFDPAGNGGAGTFTAIASLITGRGEHTATLLPSGEVLVAGGAGIVKNVAYTPFASAELLPLAAAGGACAAGRECTSGFCVDGVCCDTACEGGCNRCDLKSKVGTCSVVPAGTPGANPTCALPYACDGVNAACPTRCTSDAPCAATFTCNVTTAACEPAPATCTGAACTPPPATTLPAGTGDAGGDGGCSVVRASATHARWQLAWFAAAAGLVLLRRRRRQ